MMNIRANLWLLCYLIMFVCSKVKNRKGIEAFSKDQSSSNTNLKGVINIPRVLEDRFHIDYKKLYKLRFDPTLIYREITDFSQGPQGMDNKSSNEIILRETIDSATHLPTRNFNLQGTNSDYVISTNKPTQGSYIMKPFEVKSTISIIGNRLKELLMGSTSTLMSPPVGKGLLNIFEVTQFENIPCKASLNGIRYLNGTCYHNFECISKGGDVLGACANGYGVCCIFEYGCGMKTEQQVSYFESPKFPLPVREQITCVFTIKLAFDVNQVRLDFLFFELRRPTEGSCIEDQFIISGQNSNFKVPVLCGINTGQHIYIQVNNSPERKLFLAVFGKTEGGRAFRIRVLQLRKGNLAPEGCLQYHTKPYGHITSFNYNEMGNIVESRVANYLVSMN